MRGDAGTTRLQPVTPFGGRWAPSWGSKPAACTALACPLPKLRAHRAARCVGLHSVLPHAVARLPVLQYKDRVRHELIKPAVDWRKSPTSVATMSAAVAEQ